MLETSTLGDGRKERGVISAEARIPLELKRSLATTVHDELCTGSLPTSAR